jgi:hypothetical protein
MALVSSQSHLTSASLPNVVPARVHPATSCRHIIRSLQLNKPSGLITITTRVAPKVLRSGLHCCKCGRVKGDLLAEALGVKVPDWELSLDPTGPLDGSNGRVCMTCK